MRIELQRCIFREGSSVHVPAPLCAGIETAQGDYPSGWPLITLKEGRIMKRSTVVVLAVAGLISMGAIASAQDRTMLRDQDRIYTQDRAQDRYATKTRDQLQVRDQTRLLDGSGSGQGTLSQDRTRSRIHDGSGSGSGSGMRNSSGKGGGRR